MSKTLPKTISHYLPPTIININNKKFAIVGGKWFEVDDSVTYDLLLKKHKPSTIKEKQDNASAGSYRVKSSTSKAEYIVEKSTTGSWSCTCPSYGFRRKCKHIEQIKAKQ